MRQDAASFAGSNTYRGGAISGRAVCAECMKERQKLNYREYRSTHYAKVLETNRRCMAKRREEQRQVAGRKKDTIVAIGYAERQMAETLKMAGGVKTEL